jgi:hypothetical protein
MTADLLLIILMLATIAYWLDSIRSKELAREAGRRACKKYQLTFLDDTVVIRKLRLRRDYSGKLNFYREYQFEFTQDGEFRYKGMVIMLGKIVQKISMDAYHAGNI